MKPLGLVALALGGLLAFALLVSIAAVVVLRMSDPSDPVTRRRLTASRAAHVQRALLSSIGVLLAALLYESSSRPIPWQQEVAAPLIFAPQLGDGTAPASFRMSGPEILPPFVVGETCSKDPDTIAPDPLVDVVERELAGGSEVLMLVVGGHDARPLRGNLLRTYGSNHNLAHLRAACVRDAVIRSLRGRKVTDASLVRLRALLVAAGALRTATDGQVVSDSDMDTDRRTEVFILSVKARPGEKVRMP